MQESRYLPVPTFTGASATRSYGLHIILPLFTLMFRDHLQHQVALFCIFGSAEGFKLQVFVNTVLNH